MNLKKQAYTKDKTYEQLVRQTEFLQMQLIDTRRRKAARLEELTEELSESKALVAELTEVGLRRSARVAALKREIEGRDVYIAQLKAKISELETRLAHMRPMPSCGRCGGEGHNRTTCPRR